MFGVGIKDGRTVKKESGIRNHGSRATRNGGKQMPRKKINKVMKEMEDNYGKDSMPKMPWKRLYQSEGVDREPNGNHTSMSTM